MDGAARMRHFARPGSINRIIDAVMAENPQEHIDVGEVGHVFERHGLARQQCRDH